MMEYSTLRVCFSSPEGTSSVHTIFCKRHSARQSSEQTPTESTLFTLGWPPYCDKDNVSELFSRAGHVCAVYLQSAAGPVRKEDQSSFQSGPVRKEDQSSFQSGPVRKSSFQSGYIVFSNASEVTEALRLCSVKVAIPCGVCKVGLAKWTYRYVASRPLVSAMEVAVDEGVGDYDLRTEMGKAARKLLSQPDDDGWITVVKKGPRTSQPSRRDRSKQKKRKELVNFYRFQQRETQRQHIADLRRKFEQDKERVTKLKARRKFRPF